MQLDANVFDVWTFRRTPAGVEYLLLHTSQLKADRWFNGGRFWQIPSNFFGAAERVTDGIARLLSGFGVTLSGIWAAEHVYTIYNRRFEAMKLVAYRGLKEGLASTREYVTGRETPLPELKLA
jgi:hypothetical protein